MTFSLCETCGTELVDVGKACKACGTRARPNAGLIATPVKHVGPTESDRHHDNTPESGLSNRGTDRPLPPWKRLFLQFTVVLSAWALTVYLYVEYLAVFARDYLLLTEDAGFIGAISILTYSVYVFYSDNKTFRWNSLFRYAIGALAFYYFLLTYEPFVAPLLDSKLRLQSGIIEVIGFTAPFAILFVSFGRLDFLLSSPGSKIMIVQRLIGASIAAAGLFLLVGNRTGSFTTFPFAGTILLCIGLLIVVIGLEEN